ncbi:MAG: phosphatase PAP2 family protein [Candidatus Terrybacteria bacterium]|nr:phosphatase PAP2 family protein [Candidatus Terrybacteria bacterium]
MNQALFYYLNNFSGRLEWFDDIIVFFAKDFGYLLVLLFIGLLVFGKRTAVSKKKIFLFAGASVFLSRMIITEIIRAFYYCPRPFASDSVNQLLIHDYTGSFPSGHAAFFFALAMAVYLFSKGSPWKIQGLPLVFFIGAALIGISRVVAGIHWPLDILGGAVVGIFSSWIIYYFFKSKLQNPAKNSTINSNAEI